MNLVNSPLWVLLGVMLLSACSGSYEDLESAFGSNQESTGRLLRARSLSVTSQRFQGVTNYGRADIRISKESIDIDLGVPFLKQLKVPSGEIAGCSMTCFGSYDRRVNLLIPRTGTNLMVSGRELLDWCWSNRKPMLSREMRSSWEYRGAKLPSYSASLDQFTSRSVFDKQAELACQGY